MFKRLSTYFKESRVELGKVTWPTRSAAVRLTITVVLFSILLSAFVGGVDYLFANLLQKVILKV